jgi:hypothetical protein
MKKFVPVLTIACVALLPFEAAAAAEKYNEIEVTDGGTISGKVTLGSAAAETEDFLVTKDFVSCGTGTRTFEWVRASGEALLDAVVYVDKVAAGKPFPDELKKIVVDQKKCDFLPRVQAMAQGGEILTINSDEVWHSVHTYELINGARRTISNVSQPQSVVGFKKKIKLRRGRVVKFECDAHDYMHGWVFVARNPYYAIVDDNGAFSIADVPPGKYVVRSWHGRLAEKEATVEVGPGADAEVNFRR